MKHLAPGHTAGQGLRWAVHITTVHAASQISTLFTQMVTVLRQVLNNQDSRGSTGAPHVWGPLPYIEEQVPGGPPSHLKANPAPAKQSRGFCEDPLGDLNSE